MTLEAFLRRRIKAGRSRNASSVRIFDWLRLTGTADGWSRIWTMLVHARSVHQTTTFTSANRYPEIFDLAAVLQPRAVQILSFGCSTGEELMALRERFADAEIIGVELNPRCRAIARRRVSADCRIRVIAPNALSGTFDIICAMAVFQREPHKIDEMKVEDLAGFYSFGRFEDALGVLVASLRPGGIFCIDNAQYRVEDSIFADVLSPLPESPAMGGRLFGPDGRKLEDAPSKTIFRKR